MAVLVVVCTLPVRSMRDGGDGTEYSGGCLETMDTIRYIPVKIERGVSEWVQSRK